MIEEKIKNLREKLNNSRDNDENYETIYEYSVELDQLIAHYYTQKQNISSKS